MPSHNPTQTAATIAATGRRFCMSCGRYAPAVDGVLRDMRSRHGYVKRWVCGTCSTRRVMVPANTVSEQ